MHKVSSLNSQTNWRHSQNINQKSSFSENAKDERTNQFFKSSETKRDHQFLKNSNTDHLPSKVFSFIIFIRNKKNSLKKNTK